MKYLIPFLLLFSFACSSHIEKDLSIQNAASNNISKENKDLAQQLFIDASILDMEGKIAEAILDYQEALRLDPSPGIYYSLGKDYLRLNKLSPALENTKMAVQLEPNNIEYLTLLGTIYSFSRNIDSSKTIFEKIVRIDSTNVTAWVNLAQLNENEQPLKSLELYYKILELTGPEWNVLLKVAELNERLGKASETVHTVEELLELNPSSLELQKLLIESYIKSDQNEKAIEMVNSSIEIFPEDLNLIELKGNAYINMKEWEKGADEYKRILTKPNVPLEIKMRIGTAFYSEALNDSVVLPIAFDILQQIDKDSADWQINAFMGEIANKQKEDSLTIFHFRRAIELAELNTDLWIRFGQILFENGDYINAASEMEKGIVKFPSNFVLNLILGLSHSQNAENDKALEPLKKAVELNPNDLNATMALSFTLNQTKQNDEALKYLERALRIDQKNTQALSLMGMIYAAKDMFPKSDSLYDLVIRIDSNDILTLNNFAYSLAERGTNLEKALKMAKIAVEKDPENSSYLDTIGWVYFMMNNYTDAKVYIEKAINYDSTNVVLLDHLGDVYFRMNETEKAKQYWQEALKLDETKIEILEKLKKGLE